MESYTKGKTLDDLRFAHRSTVEALSAGGLGDGHPIDSDAGAARLLAVQAKAMLRGAIALVERIEAE